MNTITTLQEALAALGINTGDSLLVHSRMGNAPLSDVIALLEALKSSTRNGTLAFPTFNFDFCAGKPYDWKKTPSKMGLLTELARRNSSAHRIHHPIYSFALFGRGAEKLSRTIKNISAYGDDSLFAEMRRNNWKILLVNTTCQESLTFFHHVEEMVGCDYRYLKDFVGEVISHDGAPKIERYTMLVRDIELGTVTHLEPMTNELDKQGLIQRATLGVWPVQLVEAARVFEATREAMRQNPGILRQLDPERARL